MSRKQTKAEKASELVRFHAKQCEVYTRSLERNDADMAAVMDLNRSLHAVKRAIQTESGRSSRTSYRNSNSNSKGYDPYGELLLLDLGSGRYRLAPDGQDTLMQVVPKQRAASNTGAIEEEEEDTETNNLLSLQPIPESELTMDKQELCVDFLLRLRLRRKLLSRIARRVVRVATSFDATATATGGDVMAPPGLPKYGDLRLHCDAQVVHDQWNEPTGPRAAQEAAWRRILETREAESLATWKKHQASKVDDEPDKGEAPQSLDTNTEEPSASQPHSSGSAQPIQALSNEPAAGAVAETERDHDDDPLAADYAILKDYKDVYEKVVVSKLMPNASERALGGREIEVQYPVLEHAGVEEDYKAIQSEGIGAIALNMTNKEKEDEFKRWKAALLARIPEQPTYEELGLEHVVFFHQERRERVIQKIKELEDETTNRVAKEEQDMSTDDDEDDDDDDLDEDDTTKADKRDANRLLDANDNMDDGEEMDVAETVTHKAEEKIKLSSNAMIADEMIDHQSDGTFQDETSGDPAVHTGSTKHGARSDAAKSNADANAGIDALAMTVENAIERKDNGSVKGKEGDEVADNSNKISVKREENARDDGVDESRKEGKDEDDKPTKKAEKGVDKMNDEGKKGDPVDAALKVLRPISLAAVPSFYEQDMHRIRKIHEDLTKGSVSHIGVHKLREATQEFNYALQKSMELQEHRLFIQSQLHTLSNELKHHSDKLQSEYLPQWTMARHMWNAGRIQFEANKLNQMLPSRTGRAPMGTQITQQYRSRPDRSGVSEVVGDCLSDIVDSVEGVLQGRLRNDRYDPFVPPLLPLAHDPESLQRAQQVEANHRIEVNAVTLRLRTSEGDRLRAWRKLLKSKAELGIPHQQISSSGAVKTLQLDPKTIQTLPLPALTRSAQQQAPAHTGQSHVSSYTPFHAVRPSPAFIMSDSKYSTARVRDRISVDGTVAPVTKPKVTKEGLYQRPAGRTRKGMEWDTIRGIWIPAPEAS